MRLLILSAVSVFALAASANAADMYVPAPAASYKDAYVPVDNWSGFYAGINGGYGWGSDSNISCVSGIDFCDIYSIDGSKSFTSSGGFGGGQIGYNWQPMGQGGYKDGPALGGLVFGIEADLEGSDITGSGTLSNGAGAATAKDSLDWFGTVRGRLGYAVGSTLFYGTGGVAFGGIQDKLTATGSAAVTRDTTATGYVAGAGIEYKFNRAWSAKVEYQYINLGSDTLVNDGVSADFNHEYNTVRVGLNYHLAPAYEPLK